MTGSPPSARTEGIDSVYVDLLVFAVRDRRPHLLAGTASTAEQANTDGLPTVAVPLGVTIAAAAGQRLASLTGTSPESVTRIGLCSGPCEPVIEDGAVRVRYAGLTGPDIEAPPGWTWTPVADAARGRVETLILGALCEIRYAMVVGAIAIRLCRAAFTMSDLREAYEAMWGIGLDPGNFTREMQTRQFLRATGTHDCTRGGRPAKQYHADPEARFALPMMTPVDFTTDPRRGL